LLAFCFVILPKKNMNQFAAEGQDLAYGKSSATSTALFMTAVSKKMLPWGLLVLG
jgi:hypothetical protein